MNEILLNNNLLNGDKTNKNSMRTSHFHFFFYHYNVEY